MKTFQKIVSLVMVFALVFTLSLSVSADANTPHTITVSNPDASESHTYSAYQIFVGDYSEVTDEEGNTVNYLSNVSWGTGVNAEALLAALQGTEAFAACNSAKDVVKVLTNIPSNSAELRAFGALVDDNLAAEAGSASLNDQKLAVINVVGDGYYYVKDVTPALAIDTYSDYILLVEGDVTIEAKDTTGVSSEKKVKDINDSTLEGSGWQDSADYDIGDPVPFKLSGTVAEDYDLYNTYKLIFHDVESAGLTFDHIDAVYVDDVEIVSGFELIEDPEDGCTFEVVFANLKAIDAVHAGSEITVQYTSVLNENAIIGEPGNPNVMCMEFSNNPTDETSTGYTPEDKVVVFTYEVIIDKVDENGNPLEGAEFMLEKWIPNADIAPEDFDESMVGNEQYGEWVLVPADDSENTAAGNGEIIRINGRSVRHETDANGVEWLIVNDKPNETSPNTDLYLKASEVEAISGNVASGMTVGIDYYEKNASGEIVLVDSNFGYKIKSIDRVANQGATFIWKGVDDGWYRFTETQTPSGYNSLEPVIFEIVAEHEELSEDPILIDVDGDPFLPIASNLGILAATVVNESGGILPTTGGTGTTLFYVLGALLVLGAAVVLIVKKYSDA